MDSLTKKFLGEDLTATERLYLKSLSMHDGFPVLQKMFDQACRLATNDIITLDPEEKDYDVRLKYRQQRARIINEFCGAIRKSFEANVAVAPIKEQDNAGNNSRPA